MENQKIERGTLYLKKDTEIVTENFKKREFVLETIEQYPQKLIFQLTQDKTALIDNIQPGQTIDVFYNLRGVESKKEGQEAKFFLSLQAWKITQ